MKNIRNVYVCGLICCWCTCLFKLVDCRIRKFPSIPCLLSTLAMFPFELHREFALEQNNHFCFCIIQKLRVFSMCFFQEQWCHMIWALLKLFCRIRFAHISAIAICHNVCYSITVDMIKVLWSAILPEMDLFSFIYICIMQSSVATFQNWIDVQKSHKFMLIETLRLMVTI